jgi:quercetin dioxygenase-like cupin family protein
MSHGDIAVKRPSSSGEPSAGGQDDVPLHLGESTVLTGLMRHNGSMSDEAVTLIDVLTDAPIESGKLGHHTVLSVGGLRVIALTFDRGQQMREHRTHHPVLLQALDGHVRVTADGRVHDLRPGVLLYLPDAQPHSVEALEPSRITLTPIGIR